MNDLNDQQKRKNYVRYIAHRPGAERFGTHGLFTDANIPIDLNAVADEVAEHKGILMTEVLSIRREDAVRLGFDKGEVWRDMLRSQTTAMAQAMNIPLEDLRWYAAFHNESHHLELHNITSGAGGCMGEAVIDVIGTAVGAGILYGLSNFLSEFGNAGVVFRVDDHIVVPEVTTFGGSGVTCTLASALQKVGIEPDAAQEVAEFCVGCVYCFALTIEVCICVDLDGFVRVDVLKEPFELNGCR